MSRFSVSNNTSASDYVNSASKSVRTSMVNYVGPVGMLGSVLAFFASLAQWGDPIWAMIHAWWGWLAIFAWWFTGRTDFMIFIEKLRMAIWHLITVAS